MAGWARQVFQTDLLKGLTLTLRYFLRKPVTEHYPEERVTMPERHRGAQILKRRADGTERCVGCGLCAEVCPSSAISIETSEGDDHQKRVDFYQIDLGLCIFCGFCQEVCPVNAVFMGRDYELSVTDPSRLKVRKDELLAKGDAPEYGKL